uniref:Putative vasotab n=1 Tax=Tabanus bromius TaxID=304241 RepID=A0A0K8TM25_TABBR
MKFLIISVIALICISFTDSNQGRPCPSCSNDWTPVCGICNTTKRYKTFQNQCLFRAYNCHNPHDVHTKVHDGECEEGIKKG